MEIIHDFGYLKVMAVQRVMVILGTRPEAIKMAPVIQALQKSSRFEVEVLSTGQHGTMLDSALEIFNISPTVNLSVMQKGQSLDQLNSKALEQISNVIREVKPDLVLVHGDTTSAYSGAVAAFYENVAVGHVEAGLRTFDLLAPFPEEFNRQTIARIAKYSFTPTQLGADNLRREGVKEGAIFVTGNSIVDASKWASQNFLEDSDWVLRKEQEMADMGMQFPDTDPYALLTLHRRENRGGTFESIMNSVKSVASENEHFQFIFPVHPNPLISGPAQSSLSGIHNIHLLPPLDYLTFLYLLSRSNFILSDSGGIQEEGTAFDRKVLVARSATERPEGIATGHLELHGAESSNLNARLSQLCKVQQRIKPHFNTENNPYGDGKTGQRIVGILEE